MDYFSRGEGNDEIADRYDDHEYFQPENIEPSPNEEQQSLEENSDENKEVPNDCLLYTSFITFLISSYILQ